MSLEVHLLRLPNSATAAFGVILDNSKYANPDGANTLPGWEKETIGLHTDDGGVYLGTSEAPFASVPRTFKEGDVVGIGHILCNGNPECGVRRHRHKGQKRLYSHHLMPKLLTGIVLLL